ncbi:MAG: hypothetical protein HQK53_12980 [Oligoflexia bacterium]|nr:hypothetical protein [Oligoflexia bacterium]
MDMNRILFWCESTDLLDLLNNWQPKEFTTEKIASTADLQTSLKKGIPTAMVLEINNTNCKTMTHCCKVLKKGLPQILCYYILPKEIDNNLFLQLQKRYVEKKQEVEILSISNEIKEVGAALEFADGCLVRPVALEYLVSIFKSLCLRGR